MGLVSFSEDEVRLTREERRQRVRTLLWAVPDERIEYEVVRYEKNIAAQARKKEHDSRSGNNNKGGDGLRRNKRGESRPNAK
jgi:hypothetical protein